MPGSDSSSSGPAVSAPGYTVVIPTVGRASLQECLDSLAGTVRCHGYPPLQVVLADDRPDTPEPLPARVPEPLAGRVTVVTLEGRGPAAARNAGWQAADGSAEWVVFLDDDVRVSRDWARDLAADLRAAAPGTGGVQGTVTVPWPPGTRPADSQRATLGLAGARWITADMAYRRAALEAVGGFDERFPRAYREDSDLALRVADRGWTLRAGNRRTLHPVPPPRAWASLRAQAGNADDAAMRRLHGQDWRRRAGAAPGRRRLHFATCASAGAAVLLSAARLPRAAGAAAAVWAALTAEFAARRILPGPRTAREITAMTVTSVIIPPLAAGHWLRGAWQWRDARPWQCGTSQSPTRKG